MKKRDFLQAVLASGGVAFAASRLLKVKTLPSCDCQSTATIPDGIGLENTPPLPIAPAIAPENLITAESAEEIELVTNTNLIEAENDLLPGFKHSERDVDISTLPNEEEVDSYLSKIRNFDANFANDIYLSEANSQLIGPVLARLERVQTYVGHGNYNLLNFDDMLFYARNYPQIGSFSDAELNFLDEIFFTDAAAYGFFGEKVTREISNSISLARVEKISNTGHYLLKGESFDHFQHIYRDVGERLLLTSGLRNIVKQMHLFLVKTQQSQNNLSKASRSLAPPGYSFHGVGDFDVGKIGLGKLNFTADFSHTEEFERMINLGYIDIRYTDRNLYGVRYEPWHIKIS